VFFAVQFLRRDFRANAATLTDASSTADRSESSARNDAARNSERLTGSCSTLRCAPSKRAVSSSKAVSPRSRTPSMMVRVRSSTAGSNKLEAADKVSRRAAKFSSV
jgi:hypothetical protein